MGLIIEEAASPVEPAIEEIETAYRHRWKLSPVDRARVKRRMLSIVEKPDDDLSIAAARIVVSMMAHDQDDQHHLEGQKVNLTATIQKAPDEEARDLRAELMSDN
jgi:hypothetical protein